MPDKTAEEKLQILRKRIESVQDNLKRETMKIGQDGIIV